MTAALAALTDARTALRIWLDDAVIHSLKGRAWIEQPADALAEVLALLDRVDDEMRRQA